MGGTGKYPKVRKVYPCKNRPARLDVRLWKQDGSGSKVPLKGIQLTDDEAQALCNALNNYIGRD